MALDSQLWAPAALMPMAESSLYRQRLEVIVEKRRLQELICAARRDLDDERLRLERLKRKSLRERWLMDGAAEDSERPGEPPSEDPQSPQDQAQARIRHLEDSLFTLQSQLRLLQTASTGALHKPTTRPAWRRQSPRPLSQPPSETVPEAGPTAQEKRASLPSGVADTTPETPSQPAELRDSTNGPHPPTDAGEGGCVVQVVWAGLRDPGDCEDGPPALEARVEALVREAIGDRLEAGGLPELPCWVRGSGGAELVWEGVGAPEEEAKDAEALGSSSSPRLQWGREGSFIWVERAGLGEDWEEVAVEGVEGPGAGDARPELSWAEERRRAGEEGVDRWVEVGREGRGGSETEIVLEAGGEGVGGPPGAERGGSNGAGGGEGGGEEGKAEATEELLMTEKEGGEKLLAESGGGDGTPETERDGGEELLEAETTGGEPSLAQQTGVEASLQVENEGGEKQKAGGDGGEGMLEAQAVREGGKKERDRGEEFQTERGGGEREREGGEEFQTEREGGEREIEGGKELQTEREGGEELQAEREGGEKEREGDEESQAENVEAAPGQGDKDSEAEKTPGTEDTPESEAQSKGPEEEVTQKQASTEEPRSEEDPAQPEEKPEGSPEEVASSKPDPAAAERSSGNTAPLLADTLGPSPQPPECQPLLQAGGAQATVPSYGPAGQPEPVAQESGAPKQKTCQCCVLM